MATNGRTPERVREELAGEREQLAGAVERLRSEVAEATDITGKVRAKLPMVAVGAVTTGFLLSGGIGATMRLFARRGREGRTKAGLGRFWIVERYTAFRDTPPYRYVAPFLSMTFQDTVPVNAFVVERATPGPLSEKPAAFDASFTASVYAPAFSVLARAPGLVPRNALPAAFTEP